MNEREEKQKPVYSIFSSLTHLYPQAPYEQWQVLNKVFGDLNENQILDMLLLEHSAIGEAIDTIQTARLIGELK
jgi:hypothetical protein